MWRSSAARRCQIGAKTPGDNDAGAPRPFTDRRLDEAYGYWRRKAAGRSMPSRADIDPIDIPRLLPDVMLVEIEGSRYRYRLIGTENAQAQGVNATGRYLDEVLPGPEYRAHVLRLYDECVHERRALYSECLFFSPGGRGEPERHTKVLFMPLSSDGEHVNMIFVVQVFLYIDPGTRERHFVEARPYQEITHILL